MRYCKLSYQWIECLSVVEASIPSKVNQTVKEQSMKSGIIVSGRSRNIKALKMIRQNDDKIMFCVG